MPKLNQPNTLEKIAFDFFVAHVLRCCADLSSDGLLAQLRQAVADIKHHVYDQLPGNMFAEFCRRFLKEFHDIGKERWKVHLADYCKAALEIIMDVKIVGLKCEGDILNYLDVPNSNRIQGLEILDWSMSREPIVRHLESLQLQDLTTLIKLGDWTDLEFEILGSRCSRLEVLKIVGASSLTDRGLRALRPCSELRVIHITVCSVTDDGVNDLLNVHKKLEEFSVLMCFDPTKTFNILSRPISSVCPSVKRLTMEYSPVTNAHFSSALALFPNLTRLELSFWSLEGDLCLLKDFKNLTELKVGGTFDPEELKPLLTIVGENISYLYIAHNLGDITQNYLDFIFEACGNVEFLKLNFVTNNSLKKLVIPPFKKLKTLKIYLNFGDARDNFEFGTMMALEYFCTEDICQISNIIESMILDNTRFPNLKKITTRRDGVAKADRIRQIAKDNNLDFSLKVKW